MKAPSEAPSKILIHCPQCRGNIDFLEEAQVIRCEFCNTSLLVAGRDGVLRYILPPRLSEPPAAQALALEHQRARKRRSPRSGETFLFYAPFWRMQGMAYRWTFGFKTIEREFSQFKEAEAETKLIELAPAREPKKNLLIRVLDHTIAGYSGLPIGLSTLGIRIQALRLQAFEREHLEMRDSFLPLEIPLDKVTEEAESCAELPCETEVLSPECLLDPHLVGTRFSVVYAPIWCVQIHHADGTEALLVDALAKNVMGAMPDESLLRAKLRGDGTRKTFEFSEIRFLPFRCPNCGWEFPYRPLSILHFCPNCRRLFHEKNGKWAETEYGVAAGGNERREDDLLYVPFWRCRASLDSPGERLENMAALYRLAPPPKVVDSRKESSRPIYFYIPAVKFRDPHTLYKLGSRLTYLQPELHPIPFPDGSHPLTAGGSLSPKDLQALAEVILGSMVPQNRRVWSWLKDCRVEIQESRIIYFPFARTDLFWREITSGISFQQNALSEDLPKQKH